MFPTFISVSLCHTSTKYTWLFKTEDTILCHASGIWVCQKQGFKVDEMQQGIQNMKVHNAKEDTEERGGT